MSNGVTRRGVLAGAAGVALATGIAAPDARAEEIRILRVRTDLDPQSLDPGWMIGGLAETALQYACLGTLAVYESGPSWSWRPSDFIDGLAPVDDLRITFRLKPGIPWSGGNGELTAEDVKYSIERIADPKNEAPWAGKWAALDRVQVDDVYSGTIVLKEPFAPLWLTTLPHATASFVSKKAVEAKGGRFDTEFPATCGPYMVKQWLPKQRVELVANPDWPGVKPAFEEVHIVTVEDEKTAELAFEAGDLEVTAISLDSLPRYRDAPPSGSHIVMRPGTFWTWLGMNTEHPALADIRVRQAIQHAVDVDAIIMAAYAGLAPRSNGIVPPGLIGHRTETRIVRDLDKAKALLAEAGAEGLKVALTTLNKADRLTASQIIQANLAEAGIEVEIIPYDEGTFWNLGLESEGEDWKNLQLVLQRFGDAPDPSQMVQWYVSSQVGVWNWERWKSDEFDKLAAEGVAESDTAKRDAIYVRLQEIMEETGAYVWITHEPIPHLVRDGVDPAIFPDGLLYLPGFERA